MATHPSVLAWKIPWTEGPGSLQSMGSKKLDTTWRLNHHGLNLGFSRGSAVKNPPAMQDKQETRVRSLGREDPLEKELATHSGTLAWKIPWREEPGRL